MESVKLTEGIGAGQDAGASRVARASNKRRAMIDVPKLRACPPCEIKLTNRANEWPVRSLLAPAVLRPRRGDPMPDFFTPSLVFFPKGKSPATLRLQFEKE